MALPPEAAVLAAVAGLSPGRRLIAFAGPPAAGKSTLSAQVAERLAADGRSVAVIPMDGFHLDNRLLTARGLLPRKGAPETFDAEGFCHLMARVAGGGPAVYPLFDRAADLAVAGAGYLAAETDLVLVEGNYLLFDEPPWSRLAGLWDLSVWVDVPPEELARRLVARWLDHGLSADAARQRAEANDLANAATIRAARLPADLTIDAAANAVSVSG